MSIPTPAHYSDPPGSKWVTYLRPTDAFAPRLAQRREARLQSRSRFTVARFAVDGTILPLVQETLPLAERVRSALLSRCKSGILRQEPGLDDHAVWLRCPAFWGKDEQRRPLQGHGHAFFLPADEDCDGRIDHVTIVAAQGFSDDEVRALDRLRSLKFGDGDPLRLLLIGLGSAREMRSPLFEESTTWVSATPFVVTRYPKLRGRKRDLPQHYATPQTFAAHILEQELGRLRERRPELPAIQTIAWEPTLGPHQLRPIQFQRFRRKHGDDGGRRPGGAFRITFVAPVRGPFCLGHSAHFGLGLFLPSPQQEVRH